MDILNMLLGFAMNHIYEGFWVAVGLLIGWNLFPQPEIVKWIIDLIKEKITSGFRKVFKRG